MLKIQSAINHLVQGFHLLAKPIGPLCNLNCRYCFYLEKLVFFPNTPSYIMSDEILEAYINKYILTQPSPVVEFVWQGGEPTLAGLDFYKRVISLQSPFSDKKKITNSLQTNGTLLTDDWCKFFKKHNFLVGLSIDGTKETHNRYRLDRNGNGTFDQVMNGLKLLQKHEVDYNAMVTVAEETAHNPLDVYNFLKRQGVKFIQFTPVVERTADIDATLLGLKLAGPPTREHTNENISVTPWSVQPETYGDFLISIFDEWVRNDVGVITIMNFEWALNSWMGHNAVSPHRVRLCQAPKSSADRGVVF
ncbi:MAG: radical SAM protein [Desulfobulbaceae bacterium]|nr:radical SAM protein [Desulfobulbaceae bacterium]